MNNSYVILLLAMAMGFSKGQLLRCYVCEGDDCNIISTMREEICGAEETTATTASTIPESTTDPNVGLEATTETEETEINGSGEGTTAWPATTTISNETIAPESTDNPATTSKPTTATTDIATDTTEPATITTTIISTEQPEKTTIQTETTTDTAATVEPEAPTTRPETTTFSGETETTTINSDTTIPPLILEPTTTTIIPEEDTTSSQETTTTLSLTTTFEPEETTTATANTATKEPVATTTKKSEISTIISLTTTIEPEETTELRTTTIANSEVTTLPAPNATTPLSETAISSKYTAKAITVSTATATTLVPEATDENPAQKSQSQRSISPADLLINNYRRVTRSRRNADTVAYGCYSAELKENNQTKLKRGCVVVPTEKSACQVVAEKAGDKYVTDSCKVCVKDLCNSSSILRLSALTAFIAILVFVKLLV